ncbi:MAG: glycosyltransferase [Patescibacteria group bacterium]|nr:glycosyltransferase [Patescibacteria group bacterium]MDE2015272.1 glycosyltransferase [Patescibacteria group bacterium]MDE2227078.1 glycosyltransferase [Patescibacteria group bacterium]
MEKNPLVSIIIPSYNDEKYVVEAIKSALAQTYNNIEVVVVDDGSTDNTKEVLKQFAGDRRFKYIYQTNKWLPGARNTAVRNSQGKYIAFLDADDIFMPEKIAEHVAHFEANPDCDVSYSDEYHFKEMDTEHLFKLNLKYYSGPEVFPNLLRRYFIAPSTAVLRREVFDRFGYQDESKRLCEDLEYWLRLGYGGAHFCFLPKPLVKLRVRGDGIYGGMNRPQVKVASAKILDELNAKMTPADRKRYNMRSAIAKMKLKAAFTFLVKSDKVEAKKYLLEAIGAYPAGNIVGRITWLLIAIIPIGLTSKLLHNIYVAKKSNFLKPAAR